MAISIAMDDVNKDQIIPSKYIKDLLPRSGLIGKTLG